MWRVIYLPVGMPKITRSCTPMNINFPLLPAKASTQIVKFANLQHFPNPIISLWAEQTHTQEIRAVQTNEFARMYPLRTTTLRGQRHGLSQRRPTNVQELSFQHHVPHETDKRPILLHFIYVYVLLFIAHSPSHHLETLSSPRSLTHCFPSRENLNFPTLTCLHSRTSAQIGS